MAIRVRKSTRLDLGPAARDRALDSLMVSTEFRLFEGGMSCAEIWEALRPISKITLNQWRRGDGPLTKQTLGYALRCLALLPGDKYYLFSRKRWGKRKATVWTIYATERKKRRDRRERRKKRLAEGR